MIVDRQRRTDVVYFLFLRVFFLKKMENNKEEINKTRKKSGIGENRFEFDLLWIKYRV